MKSPSDAVPTTRARDTQLRHLVTTWLLVAALMSAVGGVLRAQTVDDDPRTLFTWRDGVLGAVFVVGTVGIRPLDKNAAQAFQSPAPQGKWYLRKAAIGFTTIAVPGAAIIGASMYAAGRLSKSDRLARLGLHGTEALFIGEGLGVAMKYFFGRARPYVDSVPNPDNWQLLRGFDGGAKYRSFPSGHTVAGFAAAAAVTAETSVWWPEAAWAIGAVMYSGAAFIGLARMYDNRHWASDVIMGAAIGTFAGNKVVRYHRTNPDNRIDKWLLNASITPGNWSQVSLSLIPMR